jgi:hypothetical protein
MIKVPETLKKPETSRSKNALLYLCWQGTEIIMITLNGVCAF